MPRHDRKLARRRFVGRLLAFGGGAVSYFLTGKAVAKAQEPVGRVGIGSIDHVALPMQNTEPMLAFYRALGCQVNETQGICSVHFGEQKINFHRPALWQGETFTLRAPSAEPPCGDLCFVWEGGAVLLAATLERAGASIIEGPVQRAGGRDLGRVTGTSVYVRDPDGNLLEFMIYA